MSGHGVSLKIHGSAMRNSEFLSVIMLCSASIVSTAVNADPLRNATGRFGISDRSQLEQRFDRSQIHDTLSASEAISIAERRYEGRAVGAKKVSNGYRVRILQDDGKIKNVLIDNN
jgi:hypothetical protein